MAGRRGWLVRLGVALLLAVEPQADEMVGITRQLRRGRKKPPPESVKGWGCYEQTSVLPSFNDGRFPFCQVLEEGRAIFYWSHDHAKQGTYPRNLTVGVVARVSLEQADWVAVGLSNEASGMKGVDVGMFWPKEGMFEDRWSSDYAAPMLDEDGGKEKQLQEWVVKPGLSLVAFAYTLPVEVPCPAEGGVQQDITISDKHKTFVSWAMGKGGAPAGAEASGSAKSPSYHGPMDRGQGMPLPLLLDYLEWHRLSTPVWVPNLNKEVTVALPGKDAIPHNRSTSYLCMWVKPPTDPDYSKFHIYRTELVGDAGVARQVMHHAILYGVDNDQLPPEAPGFDTPYDCQSHLPEHYGLPLLVASRGAMASPSDQAYEVVDAAIPFGRNSSNRLWVLEVHYENSERREGLHDTTGFKLTYSPILRRHDAGVLVTGAVPTLPLRNLTSSLVIPPHTTHHHWDMCPSECLRRQLGSSNATSDKGAVLLYARLHMHMLGTGGEIRVEHADGKSEVVLRREYWDFNQQVGRGFYGAGWGRETRVKAGDRVMVRCSYDASARSNVTGWGPGAHDEMCLAYLFLAPMPKGDAACFNLQGAHDPSLDYFSRLEAQRKHNQTTTSTKADGHAGATNADDKGGEEEGLRIGICMTLTQYSESMASQSSFAKNAIAKGLLIGHSPEDVEALTKVKRTKGDGGKRGEACATA